MGHLLANDIISPYGPKKPNTRHSARGASQRSRRPHTQNTRATRVARRNSTSVGAQPSNKGTSPWSLGGPRQSGRGAHGTVKQSLGSTTFMPGPNASIGEAATSAASQAPDARINISLPAGESLSITRRQLLIGALGVGAVVVAGAAASAVSNEKKDWRRSRRACREQRNRCSRFPIAPCSTPPRSPRRRVQNALRHVGVGEQRNLRGMSSAYRKLKPAHAGRRSLCFPAGNTPSCSTVRTATNAGSTFTTCAATTRASYGSSPIAIRASGAFSKPRFRAALRAMPSKSIRAMATGTCHRLTLRNRERFGKSCPQQAETPPPSRPR